MTCWACLDWSGLNEDFYLNAHAATFLRSLLTWLLANIYIINRWEKWCVICQKFYFKSNPNREVSNVYQEKPGFLIRHWLVGDILTRMAKNCMKITKSTFWGQNSGGETWGAKQIFWVLGCTSPIPPTRGKPESRIQNGTLGTLALTLAQSDDLPLRTLWYFSLKKPLS